MDDAVASLLGFTICFGFLALLVAALIYVIRASGVGRRVAELENDLARLAQEQYETTQYLQRLHKRLESGEVTVEASRVETAPAALAAATREQVSPPEEVAPQAEMRVERETAPAAMYQAAEATVAASQTDAATAPGTPSAADEAAPPTPPSGRAPSKPMGLEQWIGVRGAAAAGALLLVLSAFYFFAYSIEHGFIGPAARIAMGAGLGVVCLLGGELRLRKTHVFLANFLDGAGIAVLYITIWAGHGLYDLYPNWAATLGMVAVTAACVTLASKRNAAPIAILGLFGGLATPMALSTGTDRPFALFGYLLLLDIAMLALARARRWPVLALLSLVGTFLYQFTWLGTRLDESRLALGVVVSLVFGLVFAVWPSSHMMKDGQREPLNWRILRTLSVLLPMLLALVLAVRSDLGAHFWPTATQLGVLCLAGSLLTIKQGNPTTGLMVVFATAGVLLGWVVGHPLGDLTASIEWLGLTAGLGLLLHVVSEFDRSEAAPARLVASAAHALFAVVAALMIIAFGGHSPWPSLAYFAFATLVAARAAAFPLSSLLPLSVGALGALALGTSFVRHAGDGWSESAALVASLYVALAALTQLGGVWPRQPTHRHASDRAAIVVAALFLMILPLTQGVLSPAHVYASTLALVVLGLLATSRLANGLWAWPLLFAAFLGHAVDASAHTSAAAASMQLAGMALTVLLFSAWPLLLGRRRDAHLLRVAAFAAPLYFLPMRAVWLHAFGPAAQGLLPVALALVGLVLAAASRRSMGPSASEEQTRQSLSGLVWSLVAATSFITVAIPLQLENEWVTIGWSLEAVILALLFRRFDHVGLKYFGLALASAVVIRLVGNPYLLDYHLRGSWRVLNWLSYTYLIPAICLLIMSRVLFECELRLRRTWEKSIFPERYAVFAILTATAFVTVLFAWVNLTIFDIFAPGRELTISLERLPARDLSLSLAWAVFALGMLAVGLWRKSMPLRVASLLLILLTAAKTFLYDLGHLSDLYRVASIAGLAVSLIVISLVYQRFVFRKDDEDQESL